MVGNTGDIDTRGVSAEFRAVIASRIHGSIRYSFARGEILRAGDDYVMLLAPEAARPGAISLHDVTGRVGAEVLNVHKSKAAHRSPLLDRDARRLYDLRPAHNFLQPERVQFGQRTVRQDGHAELGHGRMERRRLYDCGQFVV